MTGITAMPSSSIRNGYSLVPCVEPRYLTIRRRRVEPDADAMVEQDHAVRDIFLQPLPGQLCLAAFAGDDGGDAPSLSHRTAAGARHAGSPRWTTRRTRLDRVEDHSFGADGVDGVAEPDEQPLEVVLAGFLDFAALDMHIFEMQLFLASRVL